MAVTLGLAAAGTAAAAAINAMMAITAVSVVASTAIGIGSSVMQANQQKAQARYQQQVNEQNAKASKEAAQAKIENQRRARKFTQGTQLAKLGGMGALAEGSPLDIMGQSASQGMYDDLVTKHEGDIQAIKFQQAAALNKYEADVASYNRNMNIASEVANGTVEIGTSILGTVAGGGGLPKPNPNLGDFSTSTGAKIDIGKDYMTGDIIS